MTKKIFKKEKRPTLKMQAGFQIRNAICCGDLKPGDRIVEDKLATGMGISRFPIREALSSLEEEGLVVTIPFKGTYVARIGEQDVDEIYSLRSSLEELAVRLLVEKSSPAALKKLCSLVDAMTRTVSAQNLSKLISLDLNFHRTICELSGHKRLLKIWLTLENQMRALFAVEERFYGEYARLVRGHGPIFEAIEQKDAFLAEQRIRHHFIESTRIHKGFLNSGGKIKIR